VCGLVAQVYGWHAGFGIAAVCMLAGLATYLSGYRHLPARVERRNRQRDRLTPADVRVLAALIAVIGITSFQSIAYYQIANVLPIWIQQHVALDAAGFSIPIAWYQSIDPLFSILGVPLLFWIWSMQGARRGEPGSLAKIGTGAWLCMASNLVLVVAIVASRGRPVHPVWPFLACAGQGIAFLYYWPTLLALVSRAAPAAVNATMMGLAFMSLFFSNNLIGWIGGFYERMTPAAFWGLHAAIAATGGLPVLVFGRRLERVLSTAAEQPLRPSAMTHEVER
jgi:proton-dependent oligopeptide transporter, POT family